MWLQWRGRHEEALLVEARLHVAKGDPDAEDAAAAAADPNTETLLAPHPDVGQPVSAAATARAIHLQASMIVRIALQQPHPTGDRSAPVAARAPSAAALQTPAEFLAWCSPQVVCSLAAGGRGYLLGRTPPTTGTLFQDAATGYWHPDDAAGESAADVRTGCTPECQRVHDNQSFRRLTDARVSVATFAQLSGINTITFYSANVSCPFCSCATDITHFRLSCRHAPQSK